MVKMTDDDVSPPYKIAPGTRVRLESAYDGTTRRLGVMVRTLARLSLLLQKFASTVVRAAGCSR